MTDNNNNTTDKITTRWKYTNDVLAAILILSLVITLAPQIATPESLVYQSSLMLAAIWAFGKESIEVIYKIFK